MSGWIAIDRKIRDHWIWKDPEQLRAWIDIIMMANHEQGKVQIDSQIIEVKRGQRWTSEVKLAERFGWSRKRVKKFLNMLQSDGMILQECTNKGTMLTIVNYGLYQDFLEKKEQQGLQQKNSGGSSTGSNGGSSRGNTNNNNKQLITMSNNEKPIRGGGDF